VISRISSGGPWEDVIGYSRAVVAGPWILVSGCTAVVDGELRHVGDAHGQARTAFEIALEAVTKAGGSRPDVVRTRMYLRDMVDAEAVGRAHAEFFLDVRPAASMIGVAGFIDPRMLVEIELAAYRQEGT
jgi:enamine deaminase RidA (YjgF/YER057c/UK114 family)